MSLPALSVQQQGQGVVSADNLNTYEQTCDSVAQLRGFIGITGIQVYTRGTNAPNDGGQGAFYWNASGTAPDDNGVTTVVPYGSGSGEWTRIQTSTAENTGTLEVTSFGAIGDGTTDNTAFFAAAMRALAAYPNGGTLHVSGGQYNKYLFKTQTGNTFPQVKIPSNVAIVADPDVYYLTQGGGSSANSGVETYSTALFVNANMLTTGNTNVSIIEGNFKSTNAASGSTGNGGFIALKNVLRPTVQNVKLLDIFGCCRMQLSFCYGAKLLNGVVDYETPHLTPWSFEDGVRIGSGCISTDISDWTINSGDDCISITNEAAECQDVFTTPADSRIPASSTVGANITNVTINNIFVSNQAGNALRVYQGPGMSAGVISKIEANNICGKTQQPFSVWSTAVTLYDNSGISTNAISDVAVNNLCLDCSSLGTSGVGTPAAFTVETTGGNIQINDPILLGVSTSFGLLLPNGVAVTNPIISGCVADSIYINGTLNSVIGGTLSGAGRSGVNLATSSTTHNRIIGVSIPSATGAAINEASGASYNLCADNDVSGSGACTFTTTNTGSVQVNNIGYNPVGASALTPGSSPWTYTASTSPETVYLSASTSITALTQGGVSVLPHATGANVAYTLELGAGGAAVISYTGSLTALKMVH